MLVLVYICRNATLLEITCRGSNKGQWPRMTVDLSVTAAHFVLPYIS